MKNIEELKPGDSVVVNDNGKLLYGLFSGKMGGFKDLKTGELVTKRNCCVWIEDEDRTGKGDIKFFSEEDISYFETKMKYGKEEISCTPIP